ncbi:MAG: hypothetical protein IJU40_04145 [Desulfovibrionaceae bacterium]|nr:hypothetical protein [Desulfovibrionaceae bacterium]
MVDFLNLDKAIETNLTYGGLDGKKKAVRIGNDNYIIKYAKSLKDGKNSNFSYANTPICEYIGSHIYSFFKIRVHETYLPFKNVEYSNKFVICKSFTKMPKIELTEFREYLVTSDLDMFEEKTTEKSDLSILLETIRNHKVMNLVPKIEEHFWYMFVIDSIIGNVDRSNDNWGLLTDHTHNQTPFALAPVFDNGACFYSSWDESKMYNALLLDSSMETLAWKGFKNFFTDDARKINPFHIIKKKDFDLCNQVVLDICANFPFNKINDLIDELFKEKCISEIHAEFIKTLVNIRMEQVLFPTYYQLKDSMHSKNIRNDKISLND